jgi:hypothetical protein
MVYDLIIVGGGISGLWTAFRWKEFHPKDRILVLEASDRWGGRMLMHLEGTVAMPLGAGIVRSTDLHTQYVLSRFDLMPPKIPVTQTAKWDIINAWQNAMRINSKYIKTLGGMSSVQFAAAYLQEYTISDIVEAFDNYTDFLTADAQETTSFFGIEPPLWMGLPRWDKLIVALCEDLTAAGVEMQLNAPIVKTIPFGNSVCVQISGTGILLARRVVLALTRDTLANIDVGHSLRPRLDRVLSDISGQCFIRIYLKLASFKGFPETLPPLHPCGHAFIVSREPFPIVCAAYADNEAAHSLSQLMHNESTMCDKLCLMLNIPNEGVSVVALHYWPTGTHYYLPGAGRRTRKLQTLHANIGLVGEFIADQQGWTNGAIRSVEKYLDSIC